MAYLFQLAKLHVIETCGTVLRVYVATQNFYRNSVKRQELFIRYVYRLRDLHEKASSYVEAGFTLQLHANLLSWTDETPAKHSSSFELTWQLKERLFHTILSFFDKGQVRILSKVSISSKFMQKQSMPIEKRDDLIK